MDFGFWMTVTILTLTCVFFFLDRPRHSLAQCENHFMLKKKGAYMVELNSKDKENLLMNCPSMV
jgi:hypothetical protein